MPNFNSPIKAAQVGTPPSKVKTNQLHGRQRVAEATYQVPGSGGPIVGDTITWFDLPVGARVLGFMSQLTYTAGAASSTLTVGDGQSGTRHLTATSVTIGGATALLSPAFGSFEITEASKTIVSTVAGAALQAAQAITLRVTYVLD